MELVRPKRKTLKELVADLKDACSIIDSSIREYDKGHKAFYKVVAGQLRILLCDKQRGKDNSLLRKLYPNLKLHPLISQPDSKFLNKPGVRCIFFCPAEITVSSEGHTSFNLFDLKAERINIDKWLDQYIVNMSTNMRILIRSVSDKAGGAHVDEELDDTLIKTTTSSIIGHQSDKIYVIEIGKYVLSEVKKLLRKEGIALEN